MRRHLLLRALVLAALLLVVTALPALAAEVRLTDEGFEPRTVRVEAGEDIVWINGTDAEQTVVGEDGTWDSGPLQPGETFSIALREPGTVRYATADGELQGQIRVRPAAQAEEGAAGEDDATEEGDSGSPDDEDAAAASAALPRTGQPAGVLIGWSLLLVGTGVLALRRADVVAVRASR
jgi:hypothetical protein